MQVIYKSLVFFQQVQQIVEGICRVLKMMFDIEDLDEKLEGCDPGRAGEQGTPLGVSVGED